MPWITCWTLPAQDSNPTRLIFMPVEPSDVVRGMIELFEPATDIEERASDADTVIGRKIGDSSGDLGRIDEALQSRAGHDPLERLFARDPLFLGVQLHAAFESFAADDAG